MRPLAFLPLTSIVVHVRSFDHGHGKHRVVLASEPMEQELLRLVNGVVNDGNLQPNWVWIGFHHLAFSGHDNVQRVVGCEIEETEESATQVR